MNEPRWLSATIVLAIHSDQIRQHGGSPGLRDKALLESALARPENRFPYEPEGDPSDLAAAYGFGIARNHPFIDGNKRVAYQSMYVFLGLNGLRIHAEETDVVRVMLAVAGGEWTEDELGSWLRHHTSTR